MSGEVRRWMPLDSGYGIEDAAGPYVLHSDYADLLARYEAVVGAWREAFRHRVFYENIAADAPVTQANAMACMAVDQVEAGIRAMQDNGGG